MIPAAISKGLLQTLSTAHGGQAMPGVALHSLPLPFSSGRICHLLSWSPGILFCLRKALYSWGWLLPQRDFCLLGAVLWDLCLETQFQSFLKRCQETLNVGACPSQ